jgi:hypothetical protein
MPLPAPVMITLSMRLVMAVFSLRSLLYARAPEQENRIL